MSRAWPRWSSTDALQPNQPGLTAPLGRHVDLRLSRHDFRP
jgi:hypothetical protein